MLLQMPPVVESCLAQMASSTQLLLSNAPAMLQLDKSLLEGLAKVVHSSTTAGAGLAGSECISGLLDGLVLLLQQACHNPCAPE